MSFQLSGETVLFDIQNQIEILNQKIIETQNSIIDIPEPITTSFVNRFKQVILTVQNQNELDAARNRNILLQSNISTFEKEVIRLQNTIPVIEKEIQVRKGTGEPATQNNTLRNALLIGGALLIL